MKNSDPKDGIIDIIIEPLLPGDDRRDIITYQVGNRLPLRHAERPVFGSFYKGKNNGCQYLALLMN